MTVEHNRSSTIRHPSARAPAARRPCRALAHRAFSTTPGLRRLGVTMWSAACIALTLSSLLCWPTPATATFMSRVNILVVSGRNRTDETTGFLPEETLLSKAESTIFSPNNRSRARGAGISGPGEIKARSFTEYRRRFGGPNPGAALAEVFAEFRADDVVFGCDPDAPEGLCTSSGTPILTALNLNLEGVVTLGDGTNLVTGSHFRSIDHQIGGALNSVGFRANENIVWDQATVRANRITQSLTNMTSFNSTETGIRCPGSGTAFGSLFRRQVPSTTLVDEFPGCNRFKTGDISVPLFTAVNLSIQQTLETRAEGTTAFGERVVATAEGDFLSTLSFPIGEPVFDLPAGFTVNSEQLNIVDNRWLGGAFEEPPVLVPEPDAVWLLAIALAALGAPGRRRRELLP